MPYSKTFRCGGKVENVIISCFFAYKNSGFAVCYKYVKNKMRFNNCFFLKLIYATMHRRYSVLKVN